MSLSASGGASEAVRAIAQAEKSYQEELHRGFAALSEGAVKGLRRQLPVTRQKVILFRLILMLFKLTMSQVDWDKIGGYKLGQDLGGGRSR